MGVIEGLSYGFEIATSPEALLAAVLGAFLGTLVGILPGLGPTAGAAMVLPLTFTMDPVAGLVMIAAIYYGVQYGGSTTAVLLNIAGAPNSVPVMRDGYAMTQRGRAGAALTIMTMGSFLAGTLTVVLVAAFGSMIAGYAITLGPPEFFAIIVTAMLVLTRVFGGSLISSLLPLTVGILIATVGFDDITGQTRFTFGTVTLSQGISIIPLAVGLFGVIELLRMVANPARMPRAQRVRLTDLKPTREELRRAWFPWLRGTGLGFGIGLLPGPAQLISTFSAYRLERAVSKYRHELGTGAIEGIAAPEAANNSSANSGMIPLLSLGIPFTPSLALMLAAMVVLGITPGPLLVTQHPEVFWGILASMYVANVALVVLNLPMIGLWVSMLRLPKHVLVAGITLFALTGAYAINNSLLDVWVVLLSGVVGYVLVAGGFQIAPLALGVILGPFAEKFFRESMLIARGDLGHLVASPFSRVVWAVVAAGALVTVITAVVRAVRHRRPPSAPLGVDPEVLDLPPLTDDPHAPAETVDRTPTSLTSSEEERS